MNEGSIEVVCGPMFAGKSTELLRRVRRHDIAGNSIRLYKPAKDTRNPRVHTHDGMNLPAIETIGIFEALVDASEGSDIIAIDECQFFRVDHQDLELMFDLAHEGRQIVLAGVDTDHLGQPFPTMSTLLGMATSVTKLTAVCADCGSMQATRTQWISDLPYNEETRVGGADKYAPKCIACFDPYPRDDGSERLLVRMAVDFSGFNDGLRRAQVASQRPAGVIPMLGAQ